MLVLLLRLLIQFPVATFPSFYLILVINSKPSMVPLAWLNIYALGNYLTRFFLLHISFQAGLSTHECLICVIILFST